MMRTLLVLLAAMLLTTSACSDRNSPVTSGEVGSAEFREPVNTITTCTETVSQYNHVGDSEKDFALYFDGEFYHVFHIVPSVDATGAVFGHGKTRDLSIWPDGQREDDIDLRESWSTWGTWAPQIVETSNGLRMFYAGTSLPGSSSVRVEQIAVAKPIGGLDDWERDTTYPLLQGPDSSWSAYGMGEPFGDQCRDPFVFYEAPNYYLFATIQLGLAEFTPRQQAVAIATSTDMTNWTWSHYLPLTVGGTAESAHLVKRSGYYYLFWSGPSVKVARATAIDGPYTIVSKSNLQQFASEAFIDESRSLYAVIRQPGGQHIEFLNLVFDDVTPFVEATPVTTCDVAPDCSRELVAWISPPRVYTNDPPEPPGVAVTFPTRVFNKDLAHCSDGTTFGLSSTVSAQYFYASHVSSVSLAPGEDEQFDVTFSYIPQPPASDPLADGIYSFTLTVSDPDPYTPTAVDLVGEYVVDTSNPSVPTGLAFTQTLTEVTLTWNASSDGPSGVAQYKIERNGSVIATIAATVNPTYTDTGLTIVGNSYTYRVKAVDYALNESGWSASVKAGCPKCPPPSGS